MSDKYQCFADLAKENACDIDYRISTIVRPSSNVLVVAPHGGSIERRTSEIAKAIAGDDHSLYLFEGLDANGTFDTLHITSHRFDEPSCVQLVQKFPCAISVHGCSGDNEEIFLGGLNSELRHSISKSLLFAGLSVDNGEHKFQGTHPLNICNRTSAGAGVQIEFSDALRGARNEDIAIEVLRDTLADYSSKISKD